MTKINIQELVKNILNNNNIDLNIFKELRNNISEIKEFLLFYNVSNLRVFNVLLEIISKEIKISDISFTKQLLQKYIDSPNHLILIINKQKLINRSLCDFLFFIFKKYYLDYYVEYEVKENLQVKHVSFIGVLIFQLGRLHCKLIEPFLIEIIETQKINEPFISFNAKEAFRYLSKETERSESLISGKENEN